MKKIPISIECIHQDYNITEPQPQLYVANNFKDLKKIPEPYALNNVRSLRNLDWLIDIWINKFQNKEKKAKLFINPNLISQILYYGYFLI